MPRQYHPSILENPLNKRVFAYNVFFRRACQRKNEKCGVNAAKIEFGDYRQTERSYLNTAAPLSVSKNRHALGREFRSLENQRFSDCTPYSCGTQRKYSLGARIFFDRGAITPSFNPPQAAVGCYAPPIPPQCS